MNRKIMTTMAAAAFGVGLMATPALAEHPHALTTPGGCVDGADGLGVGQPHAPGDQWEPGQGRYVHSGLHVGATGEDDVTLGRGNSRVTIEGGATCDG